MVEDLVLAPALRWRFTDADDVAAYGDRWWPWEEQQLSRFRGRELIAIEEVVGLSLYDVISGMRDDKTLPRMAAMWISMHIEGHPVRWADFNPVVLATDWEETPEAPLGSGAAEPTADSSSSPQPTAESASS